MTESPQPCLFDELPQTLPERRRGRRAVRPAADAGMPDREAAGLDAPRPAAAPPSPAGPPLAPPAISPQPPVAAPPPVQFAAIQPAALTNPDLADLVQGLPDLRLSYLVVEAARELKRRIIPPDWAGDDEIAPEPPSPSLLRAARLAVGELSESDANVGY